MRLVGAAAVARAHTPTRDRPRRTARRPARRDGLRVLGVRHPRGNVAVRVDVATDEEYVHVSQSGARRGRARGTHDGDARGGGRRRGGAARGTARDTRCAR